MQVGVPREVKNHEYRVAMTPAGAHELTRHGHHVLVEQNAGAESAISDDDYAAVGAEIVPNAEEVWAKSELLLKVKEPVASEYRWLRKDQVLLKPGSVLVDISIDQGGCFEDSHATTHDDPVYFVHGSIFYCVTNMPGAVPHTSTYALTNATLPYVTELADRGWRDALRTKGDLAGGLSTHDGLLLSQPVAAAHGYNWSAASSILR